MLKRPPPTIKMISMRTGYPRFREIRFPGWAHGFSGSLWKAKLAAGGNDRGISEEKLTSPRVKQRISPVVLCFIAHEKSMPGHVWAV